MSTVKFEPTETTFPTLVCQQPPEHPWDPIEDRFFVGSREQLHKVIWVMRKSIHTFLTHHYFTPTLPNPTSNTITLNSQSESRNAQHPQPYTQTLEALIRETSPQKPQTPILQDFKPFSRTKFV